MVAEQPEFLELFVLKVVTHGHECDLGPYLEKALKP
jgi:hypothetical protein